MGFFKIIKDFFTRKDNNNSVSEFDHDIAELLSREDLQTRPEICKVEYDKALGLFDGSLNENCRRAYEIMGQLASQLDYIPAMLWMGRFAENYKGDNVEAAYWFKLAGDAGDGDGARCFADLLLSDNAVSQKYYGNDLRLVFSEVIRYYQSAADRGVSEAAFSMGELLRNTGDREGALQAYKQSYLLGYNNAKIRIEQMEKGER